MAAKEKDYQPVKRKGHSTVRVGDYLYMWGGSCLPKVHNNEEKKSKSSVMDVWHLETGRWEQKPTTGDPPLGVLTYAAAPIGNEIFYFGGHCNHKECYHNSLYSFNVDTFNWKELSPTTSCHGPMMKGFCDMVAIKINSEDYLAVIGGHGPSSNNVPNQPGAQYRVFEVIYKKCNEIHFFKLSKGQWISPNVTGDRPPPIYAFTLTSINNSSAILFGGNTTNGTSNDVYILNFTDTSVNCSKIPGPRVGDSMQWPETRHSHSSVLIETNSGPHLLVLGGFLNYDCWILDINNKSWKELANTLHSNLPKNVIWRYFHSLSAWSVTPTTSWMIVFGGDTSYRDTAVFELSISVCTCRKIIDTMNTGYTDYSTSVIPLDQYQEKLQERRREWEASQSVQLEDRREIDRLRRVLEEKEQIITRLQQQLQEKERQLQQAQQQ